MKDNNIISNSENFTLHREEYPQKRLSFMPILAIIFTALILIVYLVPFFYDLLLSVKEYSILRGIKGSPYIGTKNYKEFLNSYYSARLLRNTITQGVLFSMFGFIISTILGYIIISLPTRSILKNTVATLALIPVFIPEAVYVGWFLSLPILPFSSKFFIDPGIAVWFVPFIRALKYCGIPIFLISMLSGQNRRKRALLPLKVGGCFALLALMFISSNDINISLLTSNPLTYEVTESFNLFTYRRGLVNMDISYAATVSMLSRFLCLISVTLFTIPFILLVRNLFKGITSDDTLDNNFDTDNTPNNKISSPKDFGTKELNPDYRDNLVSTSIAIFIMFFIAILPYLLKNINVFSSEAVSMMFSNPNALRNYPLYILVSLIASCISVGIAATLAYPLIYGKRPLRITSMILLLFMAALASVPISLGSFLIVKNLGMFNTIYSVLFGLISPIAGVWAFVAVADFQGVKKETRYSKIIGKPAIALIFVQMAYCLNNYLPSLVYISDPRLLSPILVFRQVVLVGGNAANQMDQYDAMVFWYGIILSMIPVGVIAMLKIFGKKSSLLTILGMTYRK